VEKDTNELDLRLKISFLCYNESVEKACHGWTALHWFYRDWIPD